MMKTTLAIFALLAVAAFARHPTHLHETVYSSMFESFKSEHSKTYSSATEEAFRFAIFTSNVDAINKHNKEHAAGLKSWTMGVTAFTDLTQHEFEAMYLNYKPSQAPKTARVHSFHGDIADLPSSVNWVTKGAVTDVKNQGQCGSCWAFSTCAGIEGMMALDGSNVEGSLISLAPQELVDCDKRDDGCNGGLMDNAFTYIIANGGGLCNWNDYSYTAQDGTCKASQCTMVKANVASYTNVHASDSALMSAISERPVSIAVDASTWSSYQGGILSSNCGQQLDHGVLAAGYGSSNGVDYYLVKNSWGSSWGESGYIRVARGSNLCGIQNAASYPTSS